MQFVNSDFDSLPENSWAVYGCMRGAFDLIYIGRRFKNDTERLEKLFEMYTKMTTQVPT